MPELKVIYAHGNPYLQPWLQMWQSQYCQYLANDEPQERATRALKNGLVTAHSQVNSEVNQSPFTNFRTMADTTK